MCLSVVAYLIAFIAFMLVGFYQLHARPHRDLRMAVILFRLQVSCCSMIQSTFRT